MCQPQKVIKRNFSVSPLPERSNDPSADLISLKKPTLKTAEHMEKGLNAFAPVSSCSNALTNTSITTTDHNTSQISNQGTGIKIKVEDTTMFTNNERKREVVDGMAKINELSRRKSYESLDVVDGRILTPVNRTARQRLLKVRGRKLIAPKIA